VKDKFTSPSKDQITKFLGHEYNLTGEISRLPGENFNIQIQTDDGQNYVLKLADENLSQELIELEYLAVEHLYNSGVEVDLPRIIKTRSGSIMASYQTSDGIHMRGRLLEFVFGTPWCNAGTPSSQQCQDLGKMLGVIDSALSDFIHPASHRTHPWDLTATAQHRDKVALISDPQRRRTVEWMLHFFSACALPRLADLPHSLIHADANDENVLLREGKIIGLLDFGDCIYNPTISELAIALAYAMLDQPDPFSVGAEIIAGYHTVHPLSLDELAILYPLICGRLSTTVTIAADRRQFEPDHPNWFVTEERAWHLLEQFFTIDPNEAGNRLAAGTGLAPFNDGGTPVDIILEKRDLHIGHSLSIAYLEPLKMVRGAGQYLFDHRGRPFLDLVNNVCHVGHCHPRVVEAGQRQMGILNTNTRYLYDGLTEYAERLCTTLPKRLDTCFFVNSGSEANELAMRLAMTHTGSRDFIVVDGAYHGHTSKLIDISPYKFMGKGGAGKPKPWVHVIPMPDGYRGKYRGHDRNTGTAYGNEVGRVITESENAIAGLITESLLGCGGQIIPPEGFLETAFQHVRAAGGVCIIDEVQVGFGRVGSHFWGFEMQNVVPDIVVMGKPIGNGHPLAAVVTTKEIASSFANGMEFFSTFGGNPVACAIGLAVLDVIRDDHLQEHAHKLGTYFRDGLRNLIGKHAIIGDVRGAGLFIGVEFVRDRDTLEPAAEEAQEFILRMKARGILLSTDGPFHNVIKIKPPMVLTRDDVDMVLRCFDDELTGILNERKSHGHHPTISDSGESKPKGC
jgi:4-aminobutyrate aminotransferase-like enzyme/Ser/Thr protein kinase RdoA (MazF antagonist)